MDHRESSESDEQFGFHDCTVYILCLRALVKYRFGERERKKGKVLEKPCAILQKDNCVSWKGIYLKVIEDSVSVSINWTAFSQILRSLEVGILLDFMQNSTKPSRM